MHWFSRELNREHPNGRSTVAVIVGTNELSDVASLAAVGITEVVLGISGPAPWRGSGVVIVSNEFDAAMSRKR